MSRQCAHEVYGTGHNIFLGNMYSYIFIDLDKQKRCISNLGSSKTTANLVLNLIVFHNRIGVHIHLKSVYQGPVLKSIKMAVRKFRKHYEKCQLFEELDLEACPRD